MLTVDDYGKIRLAHRDGMSIREIARTFHHSRRKIREILKEAQPRPVHSQPAAARSHPRLLSRAIDAILAADEDAPPKQRHTAMQVFRRLRDEHGFTRRLRRRPPLRRQAPARSSRDLHSAGPRSRPAPRGRLRTHPRRFPRRPPAGAGADRRLVLLQLRLRAGAAHRTHRGDPGRPGRGVRLLRLRAARGLVGQPHHGGRPDLHGPQPPAQRLLRGPGQSLHLRAAVLHAGPGQREAARRDARARAATAVGHARPPGRGPGVRSTSICVSAVCAKPQRTVQGYAETIGQRFERDRASALALPPHAFDACIVQAAQVDKYQTVRFDNNRYSVPRRAPIRA